MTVKEALYTINSYPIPDNTIERICIVRGLDSTDTFTLDIGKSESYELCTADVYMYLYAAPDLKELEITFSLDDRERFKDLANQIYANYDDESYTGRTLGYIGDQVNG